MEHLKIYFLSTMLIFQTGVALQGTNISHRIHGTIVYLPTLTIKNQPFHGLVNKPFVAWEPYGYIYPFKRPCLSRWIFREFPHGIWVSVPWKPRPSTPVTTGPGPLLYHSSTSCAAMLCNWTSGEHGWNRGECLEDHARTWKWLVTIVSFRPLRIGLWDPFQMPFPWLHGFQMGKKHLRKTILSLEFFWVKSLRSI